MIKLCVLFNPWVRGEDQNKGYLSVIGLDTGPWCPIYCSLALKLEGRGTASLPTSAFWQQAVLFKHFVM